MQKKNVLLLLAVALIILAIFFLENLFQQQGELIETPALPGFAVGIEPGNLAPNFALKNPEGETITLAGFRNEKAVVLNFWASWCAPCKIEMPEFEQAFKKYSDAIVFLGVNLQESPKTARAFASELGISYPIVLDPNATVKKAFGVFTQPYTFFINKEGVIVEVYAGALTPEQIEEKIRKLIS